MRVIDKTLEDGTNKYRIEDEEALVEVLRQLLEENWFEDIDAFRMPGDRPTVAKSGPYRAVSGGTPGVAGMIGTTAEFAPRPPENPLIVRDREHAEEMRRLLTDGAEAKGD